MRLSSVFLVVGALALMGAASASASDFEEVRLSRVGQTERVALRSVQTREVVVGKREVLYDCWDPSTREHRTCSSTEDVTETVQDYLVDAQVEVKVAAGTEAENTELAQTIRVTLYGAYVEITLVGNGGHFFRVRREVRDEIVRPRASDRIGLKRVTATVTLRPVSVSRLEAVAKASIQEVRIGDGEVSFETLAVPAQIPLKTELRLRRVRRFAPDRTVLHGQARGDGLIREEAGEGRQRLRVAVAPLKPRERMRAYARYRLEVAVLWDLGNDERLLDPRASGGYGGWNAQNVVSATIRDLALTGGP